MRRFGTAGSRRIGRVPVTDVGPVVDGGARPAKSVVDEEFAVTATVFGEGHDAVNATVVVTDPRCNAEVSNRNPASPPPAEAYSAGLV